MESPASSTKSKPSSMAGLLSSPESGDVPIYVISLERSGCGAHTFETWPVATY